MWEWLSALIAILNSLSPIGLAGGLGFVIYKLIIGGTVEHRYPNSAQLPPETLVEKAARLANESAIAAKVVAETAKTAVDATLALNITLQSLVESSKRQESTLEQIRDGINYLKGRGNGFGKV